MYCGDIRNVDNCGMWHVGIGDRGWGGGGEKVSPKPSMMAKALSILTGTILVQHPTITNNYFCV